MVPWLGLLERVRFVSTPATVVAKIGLDQLVWTPVSLAVFYSGMTLMEGGSLQQGTQRAEAMLWPTLRINWPFWTSAWVFDCLQHCCDRSIAACWVVVNCWAVVPMFCGDQQTLP